MIVKVYGTANGQTLVFTKAEETGSSSKWTAVTPNLGSGSYVIELHAVDDAGNETYFATVKMTFDSSEMRYQWYILDVGAEWSLDEVSQIFGAHYRSRY